MSQTPCTKLGMCEGLPMCQILCFNTILQYFYKNLVDYLGCPLKKGVRPWNATLSRSIESQPNPKNKHFILFLWPLWSRFPPKPKCSMASTRIAHCNTKKPQSPPHPLEKIWYSRILSTLALEAHWSHCYLYSGIVLQKISKLRGLGPKLFEVCMGIITEDQIDTGLCILDVMLSYPIPVRVSKFDFHVWQLMEDKQVSMCRWKALNNL